MTRSRGNFYNIKNLVKDCKKPNRVKVMKRAKDDAKEHYGLETEARIISFIAVGEFTDILHDNTDELDHDPDAGTTFDAYTFKIGSKSVYFAFYKRHTDIWIVKSFHPPEHGERAQPLRNSPFTLLERLKQ